ncbi:hypothetical protein GGI04_000298 [Coemansia thaxteri]|nr:hypothetical protein GGI04_000298 [Coemansia thaxteri]
MLSLDALAAARVCKIAADLGANESHILFAPPIRRPSTNTSSASKSSSTTAAKLGSALASFIQAPTQAITHTLFGSASVPIAAESHVHPLDVALLDDKDGGRSSKGMVWLAWHDCRCLFHVFRALEYVDSFGKPTPLIDTFVSRLVAGEAALSTATLPAVASSSARRQSTSADAKPANGSGVSRLWGWGGAASKPPVDREEIGAAGGACDEEQVRQAAWRLISGIFARATALKISAEAEEVSESDAQAVLTWFPHLAYLEIQSIPRASLRFWEEWAPTRLSGLKIRYAGIDLADFLGLGSAGSTAGDVDENAPSWSRLALLDLSENPGIDQSPLRGRLAQQLPNVARLSLARCELEKVPGSLSSFYRLSWLDLCDNAISDISHISLKLGSIVRLNLARNHLTDLAGMRRLWALECLDVSENRLGSWSSILALRNLPSLSILDVRGNPFAKPDTEPIYRPQIFSAFDHRDIALVLDGRGPTSLERREMAKIPRVATSHATGTPNPTDTPTMKTRRPKAAVIEESLDSDAEHEEGDGPGAAGISSEANVLAGSSPHALGAHLTGLPASLHLGSTEKTPRVLRATELQQVAVASAHRRGNAAHFAAQSPTAHSISMKPRPRFARRATAGTDSGILATKAPVTHGPSLPSAYTYSVPSSFSTRPTSPAPSLMAPSLRMGSTQTLRDPERYRRKVEMMRAEAGSSWLRAFAELQSQSPGGSPEEASLYHGVHFEQILPHRVGSSGSDRLQSEQQRIDSKLEPASSNDSPDPHSDQPDKLSAPDTQLPRFLFPRRRAAARNREIGSLPHCTEDEQIMPGSATSPKSLGSDALAALPSPTGKSDEDVIENELNKERDSASPRVSTTPREAEAAVSPTYSEVQLLLQGIDVSMAVKSVLVSRCRLCPLADSPMAADRGIANGSWVVQRVEGGNCTVYVSSTDLIEVVSDDETGSPLPADEGRAPGERSLSQRIAAKVPLGSLVRADRLGDENSDVFIRIEAKRDRFESATWSEYRPASKNGATGSGFASLVSRLQAVVAENIANGLPEHLFKQAECLRCQWHGYIDHERSVFEAISNQEYTLVPPAPKELQCPKCRRSYLREFYAADERKEADSGDHRAHPAAVEPIWKQSFVSRRSRPSAAVRGHSKSASAQASERRAQHALHVEGARAALSADIQQLDRVAAHGALPFARVTNAISLFLQLSVFDVDGERLIQWIPAGLVRQAPPTVPGAQPQHFRPGGSSRGGGAGKAAGAAVPTSKWGLSSFLGGATLAPVEDDGAEGDLIDASSAAGRRALVVELDWRASLALAPGLAEQAVYLALSTHAIYVFSPTWDAIQDLTSETDRRAEMDLRPERYLGLLFSIPLATLGRIDIGPNRQYLALHSALLAADGRSPKGWDTKRLQQLLATAYPSYPLSGFAEDKGGYGESRETERKAVAQQQLSTAKASALQPMQHQLRYTSFADSSASSCVFMIRDRLACSDLLDSLVEIGYETRVLDSGTGEGSGRLRAINHDVEWAMHHLVQQVFLRPSTFASIDDDCDESDDGDGAADVQDGQAMGVSVKAVAEQLVQRDSGLALRRLRRELLRTRGGKQPGAMVDASSGDSVIVDKVTYEFLKLYFCVGHVAPVIPSDMRAASDGGCEAAEGMYPFTLVGSPQFLYLVRERVDVWPPPVPDLRALYRKWQRIAPPTIVTSDPDTYDPQALADELASRSNAPSSTSAATSRAASSAASTATSVGNPAASSPTVQGSNALGSGQEETHALSDQLVSSAVSQYDRVFCARPISDLRRVALVPHALTIYPKLPLAQLPSSAHNFSEKSARRPLDQDTLGCAGTSWHAMLRLEFATTGVDSSDPDHLSLTGWNVWFGTLASAQECVEALHGLATSAGVADVDFCEI